MNAKLTIMRGCMVRWLHIRNKAVIIMPLYVSSFLSPGYYNCNILPRVCFCCIVTVMPLFSWDCLLCFANIMWVKWLGPSVRWKNKYRHIARFMRYSFCTVLVWRGQARCVIFFNPLSRNDESDSSCVTKVKMMSQTRVISWEFRNVHI